MREILFKAKTTPKKSGEFDNVWVYGDLIRSGGKYYIHPKGNLVSVTGELGRIIVMHEVIPETICQYTGLTDKNGNKIWENDVIKTYNSSGIECHIEQIIWSDYGLNEGWCSKGIKSLMKYDKRVFNTGFGKSDARKCEVIGNIFDNPELLKGSEENEID